MASRKDGSSTATTMPIARVAPVRLFVVDQLLVMLRGFEIISATVVDAKREVASTADQWSGFFSPKSLKIFISYERLSAA